MRLSLKSPDVRRALAGSEAEIARAVTGGMREATDGLKGDLRSGVEAAGLGSRLARTWQGRTYPVGRESTEAAAFVFSKAPKIVHAFDRGVTIRSSRGVYLAIPTDYAGKRQRITPAQWESRNGQRLQFVYRKGGPSLLVATLQARASRSAKAPRTRLGRPSAAAAKSGRGLTTVVVFILVAQTRLRKRIDVGGTADRWAARVPGLIAANWT